MCSAVRRGALGEPVHQSAVFLGRVYVFEGSAIVYWSVDARQPGREYVPSSERYRRLEDRIEDGAASKIRVPVVPVPGRPDERGVVHLPPRHERRHGARVNERYIDEADECAVSTSGQRRDAALEGRELTSIGSRIEHENDRFGRASGESVAGRLGVAARDDDHW
jgi:hypothetical protein